MNFKNDLDLFNTFLGSHAIVLAYFSTPRCTLCKALRPKVEELLATEYPAAHFAYVDSTVNPLIAGQLSVFAVPTMVLFVEGRESSRFQRSVSMDALREKISRPYDMLFPREPPCE